MAVDLSGSVNVPGIGDMKKSHVYGAVGVVTVGVGYMYWRRARESADADPAAGEEPSAAEGDYNTGGDPYGAPDGLDAYQNPAPATVNQYEPPDPDTLPPATNAAWTARAVEKLSEVGYDAKTVAAALGRFLAREAQANALGVEISRTALAMVGPPPSGVYTIVPPAAPTSSATPTTPKPASPTTKPTPPAAKPKPKPGVTVTVRRWRRVNPPWQSSIGGIARHYGRRPETVWQHPRNAALRKRRRHMTSIQPGDRVFVVPR